MKCFLVAGVVAVGVSPSMRREWIEMDNDRMTGLGIRSLPPCGGSGLKYNFQIRSMADYIVSLHAEGVD